MSGTSDSQNSEPETHLRVQGHASYESAEEALEILVRLKEADFGDIFTVRDTQLDSEDNEGISVSFYHDETPNHLRLYTSESNDLKMALHVSNDFCESASDVVNSLLDFLPPLTIDDIMFAKYYDRSFSELDLPLVESPDLDVTGIRLKYDGIDYIVQEDDNRIHVLGDEDLDLVLETEAEDDFILRHISSVDRFVQEVL